jgi:hypothetical protein
MRDSRRELKYTDCPIAIAEVFLYPVALPASINVGSQTITIVGTFAIDGISVTLKQTNGNLIQTNFDFSVNATLSDGTTSSASYGLNFNTTVMVGLSAFPSGQYDLPAAWGSIFNPRTLV